MQQRAQQLSVRRGRHAERAASERRKQIAHYLKCPSALLRPHCLVVLVSLPVFCRFRFYVQSFYLCVCEQTDAPKHLN